MFANICDVVRRTGRDEHLQVRGYFKVIPEPPIEDEDLRGIIQEIIEEEKAEGIYVEKVRIAPCIESEATIIGTGQSFYMIKDLELVSKCVVSESSLAYLVNRFQRRLKAFQSGDLLDSTIKLKKTRFIDVC